MNINFTTKNIDSISIKIGNDRLAGSNSLWKKLENIGRFCCYIMTMICAIGILIGLFNTISTSKNEMNPITTTTEISKTTTTTTAFTTEIPKTTTKTTAITTTTEGIWNPIK